MMKFTLRADRAITPRGGHGMAIQLPSIRNTPQVYWCAGTNSWVVSVENDGTYQLHSINGMGEIRWSTSITDIERRGRMPLAADSWTPPDVLLYFFDVTTAAL